MEKIEKTKKETKPSCLGETARVMEGTAHFAVERNQFIEFSLKLN